MFSRSSAWVWYNISRSNSSNTKFLRCQKVVADEFPAAKPWTRKFVRPAETRWMVVMDGAKILFERWDEVAWLFGEWAACNIGKTAYRNYRLKSAVALEDPMVRVQVMFAARLGELVFDWAYNWIRGKGGVLSEGRGSWSAAVSWYAAGRGCRLLAAAAAKSGDYPQGSQDLFSGAARARGRRQPERGKRPRA